MKRVLCLLSAVISLTGWAEDVLSCGDGPNSNLGAGAELRGGNLFNSVEFHRELAEEGDASAQVWLGNAYEGGKYGVEKNYQEAVKWYRLAAEQGNPVAQYNLGWMYGTGNGVPQNSQDAVKWYRKAAEQGYTTAQVNLACAYLDGEGVEKNLDEAFKWNKRAAEQGYPLALYNLGEMYEQGWGVEMDLYEARHCFCAAALKKHRLALLRWGIYLENGIGGGRDIHRAIWCYREAVKQGSCLAETFLMALRPESLAETLEVFEFPRKEALWENDAVDQCELGWRYFNGFGVEKDSTRAYKLLKASAEQGFAPAMFFVGVCYRNGAGVEQDEELAAEWSQKAADRGLMAAESIMAEVYLDKGDTAMARKYTLRRARLGDLRAQEVMAVLAEDSTEHLVWLRKIAEQGEGYAEAQLGVAFLLGEGGLAPNVDEATRWIVRSVQHDNTEAQAFLERAKLCLKKVEEALNDVNVVAEEAETDTEVLK